MRRELFTGLFLGFLIKKFPTWIPEEGTEVYMLEVAIQRIIEHISDIKRTLKRNNGVNNGPSRKRN